jgi:hypothetical protein
VERSAALGCTPENVQARFSGRKNNCSRDILPPAKAGWILNGVYTQGSARFARFTLG